MSAFVQVQKSKLVNIPASTLQLKLWMCMSVWEGALVKGAKAIAKEKSSTLSPPCWATNLPIFLQKKTP